MSKTAVDDRFATEFDAFFGAVQRWREANGDSDRGSVSGEDGPAPHAYRWQCRASQTLANGEVFDVLNIPTGCGKTSLLECHLFALAWQQREHGRRSLPLRLFWVVDRRSVVDQVHAHATGLANAINEANSDDVRWVREALAELAQLADEDDRPVEVLRWRGGTGVRPESISPLKPTIVSSTVDQIGSRLLFRGYGVSERSRPIDAALVATDSFVVLDEAHIAEPFLATAGAVAEFQRRAPHHPARPMKVIQCTATPSTSSGKVFMLQEEERNEPEIERRLTARKRPRFVAGGHSTPDVLAREARRLASRVEGVIGVIANTVSDARSAYEQLRERLRDDEDAVLVIGPSRQIDRDRVLERIPRRTDDSPRPRLFVVATQTIEVGLDLDFDGIVTAAAPLASIGQRLGRLDRAGRRGDSEAVIVNVKRCPVYKELASKTWSWLAERVDGERESLAPSKIEALLAADPPTVDDRDRPVIPRLMDWHVAALAQTSRPPAPDPDIAPFLHGEDALEPADVQITWRADLRGDPIADEALRSEWEDRVSARLPHVGELLQLRIGTVRSWLAGRRPAPFSDLEGLDADSDDAGDQIEAQRSSFVVVEPPDADKRIRTRWSQSLSDVTPGAVIVLPSRLGGCDEFGWAPGSRDAVTDLGDLDELRPKLLLDPALGLTSSAARAVEQALRDLEEEATTPAETYELLKETARDVLLDRARNDGRADWERLAKKLMDEPGEVIPVPSISPRALVLMRAPLRPDGRPAAVAQDYAEHADAVVGHADRFANSLTESSELEESIKARLRETIKFAARHHDQGKLDPRFQAWLYGGAWDGTNPRAKSGMRPGSRQWREARIASGWPRGMRHEAISAAVVAAARDRVRPEIDLDLALHLILTHHGQHRPFYPPRAGVPSDEPVTIPVLNTEVAVPMDPEPNWGEHAERFATLNQRYSPWGLAAIEAALVLADRLASADMSREESGT